MNAVKHGILSKQVVVRGLNIRENSREFTALHQRFCEALDPVGPVEEMLVDQIVTTHWRLRRALTAEAGEIALSVDKDAGKRGLGHHPTLQWMEWQRLGDPIWYMEESSVGNGILKNWIEEIRAGVEKEGELSEAAIKNLVEHFGGKPNCLTQEMEKFRLSLMENPEGLEAAALRERNKQQALLFVNKTLSFACWRKSNCEKREEREKESQQAAAVIPSLDVMEKIMRYETKLERQMYRAMAQLERVQRMRKGETLPAPLTVVTDKL
jgi:hypothetical protein